MKRLDAKTLALRFWRDWLRPVGTVIIVLCSLRSAVADWNDVPTGSMKPTIVEGDRIFVNKLAYGLRLPFTDWWISQWNNPQRGDIAVLFSPDTDERLVKRVVGLPGDTIELRNNHLLINGQPVVYQPPHANWTEELALARSQGGLLASEDLDGQGHPVMVMPHLTARRFFGPQQIPPDHYFVMGDNRDQSRDSRFFGFVPRDKIVGRSSAVVISFDRDRYYLPRWGRCFHSLP